MKKGLYAWFGVVAAVLSIALFAGCPGGKTAVKTEGGAYLVDAFVGTVTVSHDNGQKWTPVASGMELRQADMIKTEANSYCDIVMPKRGIFRVSDNSLVSIAKLADKVERLSVAKGKIILNVSQKLADNESFNVETSTGVVAVRGTEFSVENDGETTKTEVIEGTVTVRPNITITASAEVKAIAEEAITVSVTSNESVALNAADNAAAEKEINEGLAKAGSVDEAKKFLGTYKEKAAKKKKKVQGKHDKAFDEIGKPEKLEKVIKAAPRISEEEKKELDKNLKDIQKKTGQVGIASDKVDDQATTKEEDAKKLDENVKKVQERAGQQGIAGKKVDDNPTTKAEDMEKLGGITEKAKSNAALKTGDKKQSPKDRLNKAKQSLGN